MPDTVICPSCGRDLGNGPFAFEWCPADRAYFCDACTRERAQCPSCKARPAEVHLGFIGLVLLVLFVTSAVAVLPQHFSRTMDIQMATTPLANVSAGQEVKVQGFIDSPDPVAFTLIERDGRWQLLRQLDVKLLDSKGKGVRLDLLHCRDFSPAAVNSTAEPRSDFKDGAKVTAFGKVRAAEDGNKTLEVRRLHPGWTDPYAMMPGWYQTLWLFPAVFLMLLVQVLVIHLFRRALHSKFLKKSPPDNEAFFDLGVEPREVNWRTSPLLEQEVRMFRLLAAASLGLAAALLAASALLPWAWQDLPILMVSGTVVLVYATAFAFLNWDSTRHTPTSVGISPKGVHFRFRPRKAGPLQTVALAWKDIERIAPTTEFGRSYLKFHAPGRIQLAIVPRAMRALIEAGHDRSRARRA